MLLYLVKWLGVCWYVLQEYLISNGMKPFDPFNMLLTLSSLDTSCIVFIDAESWSVDRLPNLLRLKRDVRVMFRQFGSCKDVIQRDVTFVFPRAGVVVLHDDAVFRCTAGRYKTIGSLSCHTAVIGWRSLAMGRALDLRSITCDQ